MFLNRGLVYFGQINLPIRSSAEDAVSGNKFRWSLFNEPKLLNCESIVVLLDVTELLASLGAVSSDVLLELLPIRNFNLNGAIQVEKKMFASIGSTMFFFLRYAYLKLKIIK